MERTLPALRLDWHWVLRGAAWAAILVIGELLLAACAAPAATPADRQTVSGTITLPDEASIDYLEDNDDARDCQGDGDFADLVEGSQVIARDGAGAVVGTGQVEVGENAKQDVDNPSLFAFDEPPCVMPFAIAVKDADFYTFNIAGWPVELVYSREDLEAVGWRLDLAPTD